MKQICAAIVLGMSIMTLGCKKDESMDPASSNLRNANTSNIVNTAIAAQPSVVVNLVTVQSEVQNIFQWNAGSLTENDLFFYGTHVVGNMLSRDKFIFDGTTTVKLFSPAAMGTIFVTPNFFNYVQLSMQLNPGADGSDFSLAGTCNTNGAHVPVQVSISEPVLLNSAYVPDITTTTAKSYTANLYLDVNALTTGITEAMIADAVKTNGVVVISPGMNTNLYRIIFNNLSNEMLNLQWLPAPANPSPATSVTSSAS